MFELVANNLKYFRKNTCHSLVILITLSRFFFFNSRLTGKNILNPGFGQSLITS